MKYLKRSKFICLLGFVLILNGCSATKQSNEKSKVLKPYLATQNDGLIYDASFSYKDFDVSGLLVMKREQAGEYHITLLSKFGVAIMEFRLGNSGITWLKTVGDINKKSVEKLLERDFRLLLLSDLDLPFNAKLVSENSRKKVYKVKGRLRSRIWLEPDSNRIIHTENKGFLNPVKTRVNFKYMNADSFPGQINLDHRNLDMKIKMNLLKVNHVKK
jgi:hypothetical protein